MKLLYCAFFPCVRNVFHFPHVMQFSINSFTRLRFSSANDQSIQTKEYSLVFCRRQSKVEQLETTREILLGMKKKGYGEGKWNAFGGKLELNETSEEAAVRELTEESSLVAQDIQRMGMLEFHLLEDSKVMKVHVFETWHFEGIPEESDEMSPKWFNEKDIPYDLMWPDDQYWMHHLLNGKKFYGRFSYGANEVLIDKFVELLNDLDSIS